MRYTKPCSLAPLYGDELCRCIGVLQQVQTLLSKEASLADMKQLMQGLQQEFGEQAQLENVIQSLVSRALEKQLICRRSRRIASS